MASATADRPKAAERIQTAAKDLFYRQGIRATGVEEVCRAAEATKMSLYRAYPSKDALVAAILCEDAAAYDAWFAEATASAPTPAAKLRAAVEAFAAKLEEPEYRGCPLLLAQAEFRDPEHPTHRLVAEHKTPDARRARGPGEGGRRRGARTARRRLGHAHRRRLVGLALHGRRRAAEVLRRTTEAVLRDALP